MTLLKTEQVLDLTTSDPLLGATFTYLHEGDVHRTIVTVDDELFKDLGEPNEVTVTIERGNKLQERADEEGWDDE